MQGAGDEKVSLTLPIIVRHNNDLPVRLPCHYNNDTLFMLVTNTCQTELKVQLAVDTP